MMSDDINSLPSLQEIAEGITLLPGQAQYEDERLRAANDERLIEASPELAKVLQKQGINANDVTRSNLQAAVERGYLAGNDIAARELQGAMMSSRWVAMEVGISSEHVGPSDSEMLSYEPPTRSTAEQDPTGYSQMRAASTRRDHGLNSLRIAQASGEDPGFQSDGSYSHWHAAAASDVANGEV